MKPDRSCQAWIVPLRNRSVNHKALSTRCTGSSWSVQKRWLFSLFQFGPKEDIAGSHIRQFRLYAPGVLSQMPHSSSTVQYDPIDSPTMVKCHECHCSVHTNLGRNIFDESQLWASHGLSSDLCRSTLGNEAHWEVTVTLKNWTFEEQAQIMPPASGYCHKKQLWILSCSTQCLIASMTLRNTYVRITI